MTKTLVILAAGLGSRYKCGIKQLESVDEQGHLIIDYSIHDAVKAGFNKIVFIIRHSIEKEFTDRIGKRIEDTLKPLGIGICISRNKLLARYIKCSKRKNIQQNKTLGNRSCSIVCSR